MQSSKIQVQQDLERRILHGLICEWESALSNLKPNHRDRIHRPLFAIKDLKTQWGNWSAQKREISLSRQLVHNYPWDSIRDVLLHEMAHQIAQQIFGAAAEISHGPAFKRACQILRINHCASADYRPLQDRLLQDVFSNQHDKRMLRIKKLLALAESKNIFEAEAAMAKAHELIAKYNIELNRHTDERQFISVFVGFPALRHHREDYHLANLLLDFYLIRGIWVTAYVIAKGKMGRVLEISGTAQNIKIAEYVHDFIRQFIGAQWLKYNDQKRLNRQRRTDFSVGIIEGFRDKLQSSTMAKKENKDIYAVMKKGDPLLERYFKYKYPRTASVKSSRSHQDSRVLRDGIKIGNKLVIAKGICERNIGKLHLISDT
jgi:predicted SprT family Zn-dependent metalloprotease